MYLIKELWIKDMKEIEVDGNLSAITACLNESSTNFLEFSSSVKEKAKNKAMQVNASNKSLFQLFIINVFMEAIIAD